MLVTVNIVVPILQDDNMKRSLQEFIGLPLVRRTLGAVSCMESIFSIKSSSFEVKRQSTFCSGIFQAENL